MVSFITVAFYCRLLLLLVVRGRSRIVAESSQKAPPTLWNALANFVRLLRLVRPYWGVLIKSILLGLVAGLMSTGVPYVTKLLIDEVYPTRDVTLMHVLVGCLLGLSIASTSFGTLRGIFSLYINSRLSSATRLMFFNHLQHLRMRFFDQHQVGEVTSRFQDVSLGINTIARVFEVVFIQGAFVLLVPPMLLLLDWRLALLSLISLPLIVAIAAGSARYLRRYWQRGSEAYAEVDAFQVEVLSHIRTFKGMGLERHVFDQARDKVQRSTSAQIRAGSLSQALGGATGLLRALNTAALTWFGWSLILSQSMSLGDYIAFVAYIGLLYNPLFMLAQLFSDFQQSAVHLGRMFEYLDSPVEQDPNWVLMPPAPLANPVAGSVRLGSVAFGYSPDQPVVQDVDLDISAGTVNALVGASGSGKTTLMRLICALEEPDTGTITIDGISLSRLPLSELRQQISIVWQDAGLIKGTLWQNLTLGVVDEPTLEEVDRIIGLCGLKEVFAALPDGYETQVAEWGASLSAGQRQRVAIARAMLRPAPLLLLDEATANIDVETEMRILRDLFAQREGRTVIYITHRPAAAALADQVHVMQAGTLVGSGSHDELLESCEVYRRMNGAATVEPAARLRVVQDI